MHYSKWSDLEHIGRTARRAVDMLARKLNENGEAMEVEDFVNITNSLFYGVKTIESLVRTHDHADRIERLEHVAHLVSKHEGVASLISQETPVPAK